MSLDDEVGQLAYSIMLTMAINRMVKKISNHITDQYL